MSKVKSHCSPVITHQRPESHLFSEGHLWFSNLLSPHALQWFGYGVFCKGLCSASLVLNVTALSGGENFEEFSLVEGN